jgi:hypothetical protein
MNQVISHSLLDDLGSKISEGGGEESSVGRGGGATGRYRCFIHFGCNLPLGANGYPRAMGEAGQLRRVMVIVLALSVAGCRWPSDANREASVTVRLPPPRPFVPEPAFSFGNSQRTTIEEERPSTRG